MFGRRVSKIRRGVFAVDVGFSVSLYVVFFYQLPREKGVVFSISIRGTYFEELGDHLFLFCVHILSFDEVLMCLHLMATVCFGSVLLFQTRPRHVHRTV